MVCKELNIQQSSQVTAQSTGGGWGQAYTPEEIRGCPQHHDQQK